MDFDFYKLQTAGNDLILVNYSNSLFPEPDTLKEIARRTCRRDYGIGGNGLIAVECISPEKISAVFIDPAGAVAETTTDAAFCLSRFIFDSGITGNKDFALQINNSIHEIGIIDSNNFRISLGIPLDNEGGPLIERPDTDYIINIKVDGRDFPAAEVFLQKTGLVVFTEAISIGKMKELADTMLKGVQFDNCQRLIFATVNSRDDIDVRIRNSRGDDFSSSCAIAALASVVNGFLDRQATITHKLGEYYFQWLQPSNEVFLTGSADYVYSGSIFIDREQGL